MEPLASTTLEPTPTVTMPTEAVGNTWETFETPTVVAEPEAAVAAAAATPAAPTLAEVQAELAAAKAQLAAAAARSAPAAAPALSGRDIAHALVEAQAVQRQQWQAQQQQAAALAPPTISEDEKARMLADPDVLLAVAERLVEHRLRVNNAYLEPRIQAGETMHALGQAQVELMANVALDRAQDMAVERLGLTARDFGDMKPEIYDYLRTAADTQSNPAVAFSQLAVTPQALFAAAQQVHNVRRGGVPVTQPRPAPTIGAGSHVEQRPARTAAAVPPGFAAGIADLEKRLGRKIDPKRVAAAAAKARDYENQL